MKFLSFLPESVRTPEFAYEETSAKFAFHSLLTQPKVFLVLFKIRTECDEVANMELFNNALIKPLWLKEFETTQSQRHTQVF